MNGEQKFWLSCWTIIALVIISILGSILLYSASVDTKVANLVKEGIHPIAANCAIKDDLGTEPICVQWTTKN